MNRTDLDEFTTAYVECALWSSTCDDETPLDDKYDIEDIEADSLRQIVDECKEFTTTYAELIEGRHEQAGHDYWLTRNGHGAGFWDRGDDIWPETVRNYLTRISKESGSAYLLETGNGKLFYNA